MSDFSEHQDPAAAASEPAEARPPTTLRVETPNRDRRPWITWSLLAISILFYILQIISDNLLGNDLLLLLGAKVNELIYAGQIWRLLTPMFLHGSILHIGFNMYALYVIGPGLELHYGRWRYLSLYLLSGFAGNVLSFILTPAPSLGASTAIFGLIAAQGIFIFRNRFLFGKRSRPLLGNILIIVLFNLILGLNPGIDNWGHLGGLLGGALFAWFSGPVLTMRQEFSTIIVEDTRSTSASWAILFAIAALFALLAFLKVAFL